MTLYRACVADPREYDNACQEIADLGITIENNDDERIAILFKGDAHDAGAILALPMIETVNPVPERGRAVDDEWQSGSNESFILPN